MNKIPIPSKAKTKEVAISADPNAFKKLKISLGIIVGVFAFLLYAQSIRYSYALDDNFVISDNNLIKKGFEAIPEILKTNYLSGFSNGNYSGPTYRPTSLILFAIEWQLFPNSPHVYHFISVLLFAVSCFILFLLLCKLFYKQNLLFPFVCCMLYAAHPIHTEVVNNIKSSDEILCFLFGISAIFFAIKSVTEKFNLNIFLAAICYLFSSL